MLLLRVTGTSCTMCSIVNDNARASQLHTQAGVSMLPHAYLDGQQVLQTPSIATVTSDAGGPRKNSAANPQPTCLMRPGVPTTMAGAFFFSSSLFFLMSTPPKKLPTFTLGMNSEKRSNSWQICRQQQAA